jgi:hypothetical protein
MTDAKSASESPLSLKIALMPEFRSWRELSVNVCDGVGE